VGRYLGCLRCCVADLLALLLLLLGTVLLLLLLLVQRVAEKGSPQSC
jgi:hypothetical protein